MEYRTGGGGGAAGQNQKNDAGLLSGDSNMSNTNNSSGERQKFQTPAI